MDWGYGLKDRNNEFINLRSKITLQEMQNHNFAGGICGLQF